MVHEVQSKGSVQGWKPGVQIQTQPWEVLPGYLEKRTPVWLLRRRGSWLSLEWREVLPGRDTVKTQTESRKQRMNGERRNRVFQDRKLITRQWVSSEPAGSGSPSPLLNVLVSFVSFPISLRFTLEKSPSGKHGFEEYIHFNGLWTRVAWL